MGGPPDGTAMFGLDRKIRSAAATGGTVVLAGAMALLGMVWLSIAAVTALSTLVEPMVAMCIIGASALVPLVIVLVRRRPENPEPQPEVSTVQVAEDAAAVVRLAHSAHLVAERSTVAGIALTLGAAFLAARSPTTSPLAVHMLAEAVETWLSARAKDDAERAAAANSREHTDPR